MRVVYCDCCKGKIGTYEKIYSLEIKRGNDNEFMLEDVCEDCFDKFKSFLIILKNGEKNGHCKEVVE